MSLDDEVSSAGYTFVCSNGSVSLDNRAVLTLSTVIQNQIKTDPTSSQFPLSDIDQQVGEYMAEYLNHHNGVEPAPIAAPIKGTTMAEVCPDAWDAEFIDRVYAQSPSSLRFLSNTALKLDIKPLYSLTCAKWALLVRGLPVEEARAVFRA